MNLSAERGDIILSGLLRMVAGLLLVGLALIETGAVAVNAVQLDEVATSAARAAAVAWRDHGSQLAAQDAAERALAVESGVALETVSIASDGSATVTLHRDAAVLFLDRVPPARRFLRHAVTKSAQPPPAL
ncbi:MAG TPA: hypothetical protein VML96_05555 [Egibacteraceae bacterium]|nr:hypothetical protein [Egibacteraceae bacterium]